MHNTATKLTAFEISDGEMKTDKCILSALLHKEIGKNLPTVNTIIDIEPQDWKCVDRKMYELHDVKTQ